MLTSQKQCSYSTKQQSFFFLFTKKKKIKYKAWSWQRLRESFFFFKYEIAFTTDVRCFITLEGLTICIYANELLCEKVWVSLYVDKFIFKLITVID